MTNKHNLPMEVHEHFRKANILHGYVTTELREASQHAMETGQELLAAKSCSPHGRWEDDCKRLFEGSARTARGYMALAKNMAALPKRQQTAVLIVEGSIEGAAKAAKEAANPKPSPPKQQPEPAETIDVESSPAVEPRSDPPTPAEVQEAVASAVEEDDAPEPSVMSQIRELVLSYEPPAAMAVFLRDLVDELETRG